MIKKKMNILCWILTPIMLLTLVAYYKVDNIPTTIFVREGQKIKYDNFISLREDKNIYDKNKDKKLNVSLLGVLPVKSVSVKSVPQIMLYPGGEPVGVKLNTKGVLVIALSDIETASGRMLSPAAAGGIQIGDSIIKIGEKTIISSEDVSESVNIAQGKIIDITIDRNGIETTKKIEPVKSNSDGKYKIGLWVRDSTAGVGTLTFYDAKSGKFAALGHPITDIDTGTILKVNSGVIVSSSIISVRRGVKGIPGELKGIFVNEDVPLGDIYNNTQCGIFGKFNNNLMNRNTKDIKPMPIGLRSEISEGPAKILTTIDGETPKYYDISIEKLLQQDTPGPKSMIIKVTDSRLIEKTGGIVQGMSGSPIIQNNKIIGAVTHVLINKPDTGYGIYIEWMLKDADILSK